MYRQSQVRVCIFHGCSCRGVYARVCACAYVCLCMLAPVLPYMSVILLIFPPHRRVAGFQTSLSLLISASQPDHSIRLFAPHPIPQTTHPSLSACSSQPSTLISASHAATHLFFWQILMTLAIKHPGFPFPVLVVAPKCMLAAHTHAIQSCYSCHSISVFHAHLSLSCSFQPLSACPGIRNFLAGIASHLHGPCHWNILAFQFLCWSLQRKSALSQHTFMWHSHVSQSCHSSHWDLSLHILASQSLCWSWHDRALSQFASPGLHPGVYDSFPPLLWSLVFRSRPSISKPCAKYTTHTLISGSLRILNIIVYYYYFISRNVTSSRALPSSMSRKNEIWTGPGPAGLSRQYMDWEHDPNE